jgi:stalled ribosome rescue protein Dom34
MSPKSYRRGYPVAVLVGLEENAAAIWQIFSQVAKPQRTIPYAGSRKDQKTLYNFHETILNALRPTLKEGVKSLIIASPPKTSFGQEFQAHLKQHHAWLMQGANRASVSLISGWATTPAQVSALTKTEQFKTLIVQNAAEETENLLEILEKRLAGTDNLVAFSLPEAENLILATQPLGKPQPEYLLLTDTYLAASRQKSRLQRLTQIAQNKKIKTRVINAESTAGARLTQLGGIVVLLKTA